MWRFCFVVVFHQPNGLGSQIARRGSSSTSGRSTLLLLASRANMKVPTRFFFPPAIITVTIHRWVIKQILSASSPHPDGRHFVNMSPEMLLFPLHLLIMIVLHDMATEFNHSKSRLPLKSYDGGA